MMNNRLTTRNEHGGIISTITGVHPDVERMRLLQRLAAYEDAAQLGKVREITGLYPADDWDEDVGPVIWWRFDETNMPLIMPYIGSPLNVDWKENGYNDRYTHFTKIYCPTNDQVANALREEAMAALEKQKGGTDA